MNCTQCGKPLEEGSKFCTACGAPAPAAEPAQEAPKSTPAEPETTPQPEAPAPQPEAPAPQPEAPAPQPEQPKDIPSPIATDVPPGELLNAQQGFVPPQQGYVPPQQGFVPPQQGYVPPQQGYVPPQQGYVPPQQGYVPPQQGYVPPQQGYVPPVSPAPEQPKKKKKGGAKKWILISVCLVLAVAVVLAIFNWKTIDNTFKKMTMSDKDYFAYVNKNMTGSLIGSLSSVSSGQSLPFDPNHFTVNGDLTLKLEDSAVNLLQSTIGNSVDISWFKEAGYTVTATTDNGKTGMDLELKLNGTTLVTIKVTITETRVTVSVPELSDKAISMDLDELLPDDMTTMDIAADMESYLALLPDEAVLERILSRYINTIFDSITEVTKQDMSVTAGGVSKDLSLYTAKIDEDVIKTALKKMASELAKDEDVKSIIKNICESDLMKDSDVSFTEVWSNLQDALSGADSSIDMLSIPQFEINYTVYVDGAGNVAGSAIDGFGPTLSNVYLDNGSSFGHEIVISIKDVGGVKIIGEGSSNGGKLNGKYNIKAQTGGATMGIAVMEVIDWDVNSAAEGRYNGKLIFKLDPNISSLINNLGGSMNLPEIDDDWDEGWDEDWDEDWGTGTAVPTPYAQSYAPTANASTSISDISSMLSQIALSVEFKTPTNTESTVIYSLLLKDDALATATINAKIANGGTVTLPSNTIDVNDKAAIEELGKNAESFLTKLTDNLEKAGLPEDMVESLKDLIPSGGTNNPPVQENPAVSNPLIGDWYYTEDDYYETITFYSDMTGNLDADGEDMAFSYTYTDDSITFNFENSGAVTMASELVGDVLYLTSPYNNETAAYYAY